MACPDCDRYSDRCLELSNMLQGEQAVNAKLRAALEEIGNALTLVEEKEGGLTILEKYMRSKLQKALTETEKP